MLLFIFGILPLFILKFKFLLLLWLLLLLLILFSSFFGELISVLFVEIEFESSVTPSIILEVLDLILPNKLFGIVNSRNIFFISICEFTIALKLV